MRWCSDRVGGTTPKGSHSIAGGNAPGWRGSRRNEGPAEREAFLETRTGAIAGTAAYPVQGGSENTNDFGFALPSALFGTATGLVWLDVDHDGVWDADDWGGIMQGLSRTGRDLSEAESFEIWINDGHPDLSLRRGRLHIDFGYIDEDGFWPRDTDGTVVMGTWEREDVNHDGIFGNDVDPEGTVFDNRPHMTTAKAFMINTANQYSFTGTTHDMTRVHQGWGMPHIGYMYDLEYILIKTGVGEASLMGSSWILNQATGVAVYADGTARIVGWGINPEGGEEAWVVTGYPFDELVFTHE